MNSPFRVFVTTLAAVVYTAVLSGCATSKPIARPTQTPGMTSGYAPANGLKMYYEIYGAPQGDNVPLLLIHGGGSTIDSTWGRIIPYLSNSRQLIAIEEQSHGRTADIDRVESFENTANDIVALLKFLKVDRVDVFGFSNGGTTALQLAIRHPDAVRKIVPTAALYSRAGAAFPGFWKGFKNAKIEMMPAPLKTDFLRVNPDPAALQKMFERDVYRMAHFKNIPLPQLKSVSAPTLVITGEKDVVTVEHARDLARLVQHGQYIVLPGTHGAYIGESESPGGTTPNAAAATALIVSDFLDQK